MGSNIELCELLETKTKTQCTVCLSYWNIGILYCTCGHLLHKEVPIKNSSITRWIFFQSLSMSSRREDLMDIDMVKSQEIRNTLRLTNWRSARREISKESMTDSYEIKNSVIEWLNIIEMKKFVDDGMLLQMKITLIIWQNKNTSTARANGGFIQISQVLILCHWGIDLISSSHCLLCNGCKQEAGEEPQVPIYSYKHQWEARSSSSTWWNWQGSWWTSYHSESQDGDAPSIEWTGRSVSCSIGKNLRRWLSRIQFILWQLDRLQLTAVFCNRRVSVLHAEWVHSYELQSTAVHEVVVQH